MVVTTPNPPSRRNVMGTYSPPVLRWTWWSGQSSCASLCVSPDGPRFSGETKTIPARPVRTAQSIVRACQLEVAGDVGRDARLKNQRGKPMAQPNGTNTAEDLRL